MRATRARSRLSRGTRRRLVGTLLTGACVAVLGAVITAVLVAVVVLPLVVLFFLFGGGGLIETLR